MHKEERFERANIIIVIIMKSIFTQNADFMIKQAHFASLKKISVTGNTTKKKVKFKDENIIRGTKKNI